MFICWSPSISVCAYCTHTLTHSHTAFLVPPWAAGQSKGIWALLQKAGKEEGKAKYKSEKDLETSSISSLCPCALCGWGQEVLQRGSLPGCAFPSKSLRIPHHRGLGQGMGAQSEPQIPKEGRIDMQKLRVWLWTGLPATNVQQGAGAHLAA